MLTAYIGNDNVVRLTGAQAIALTTGLATPLGAGAVITFRIQTLDGVDVPGETWPVAMGYLPGSDGDFIGVLRDTVTLDPWQEYLFVATADNGSDQHGTWSIRLMVAVRHS
jgi:hypothetical protein